MGGAALNPLVLYVDDDSANLVVFESSLAGRFPLRTVSSGAEALAVMEREEVAVLLTDQRMPGMSGVDLMEVAAERFPDTVRMLITAYSDLHAAIEAINRGQVHYYLRKPWDTRELRLALDTAMSRYGTTSRLRQLESRLVSTERLYALGVIAAEIAHEIRNPLSTIQSNVQVSLEVLRSLQSELGGMGQEALGERIAATLDALGDCASAAGSIEEITRSVELTTRSSESELVDMAEVVHLALRTLQPDLQRRGILDVRADPVPPIQGSRTRLGQVVLNLAANAVEAASSREGDSPAVRVRLWSEPRRVHLAVEDSGPGIDPEVLHRIYDPFFTTKVDGGTGLGLAISKRIVEEHGGSIEVRSAVGEGTRFLVSLPTST